MSQDFFKKHLLDSSQLVEKFLSSKEFEKCSLFAKMIVDTLKEDKLLFACGNGGSHCQAMHFAEEFTGRFEKNRAPLGALALGDASHMSCVGNDFGFDYIFSRQLEGLSKKGDFVLLLSTSGNSPNLLKAAEVAHKKGLRSVALLGRDGGKLKDLVELPIVIPAQRSDRIQEMHIKLIHLAIHVAEQELFP